MSKVPEYKIVTIGAHGVGKTCLINRYYYGDYADSPKPTVGVAYVKVSTEANNHPIVLHLYDTAGQEKYSNLVPVYIRDSHAVIICYDVNEEDSMQKVQGYLQTVNDTIPEEVPKVVVGTKSDLFQSGIPGQAIDEWCSNQNIPHFVTSARTGQGVEDLFTHVGKVADDASHIVTKKNEVLQKKREKEENPRGGCC